MPPPPGGSSFAAEYQPSSSSSSNASISDEDNIILPPEPSEADLELFRRTQDRLRRLHESEQQRREEAEAADSVATEVKLR